jgi:hypothetical protein
LNFEIGVGPLPFTMKVANCTEKNYPGRIKPFKKNFVGKAEDVLIKFKLE